MTERLKFIVEVDSATGVARLRNVRGAEEDLTDSMKRQEKAAKGLSTGLKTMIGTLGGFLALRSVTTAMKDWVELAGVQQEAVAGMEQAMRSMGRYTPELRDRLIDTASALQEVTTFGDEATIAGQKFLLTYKAITDDLLPETTAVMLDLAALMGGDTKMAANMLGKASMGLSGELRRVGITIDENIAKGGDFAKILEEIKKQVGGQAEALARTGIGPWKQLGNIWGDAKEDLGELTLQLTKEWLPMLKEWAGLAKEIARYWTFVLTPPDVVRTLESRRDAISKQLENLIGLQNKGYRSDLLQHMFGFDAEELAAKINALKAELLTVTRSIGVETGQQSPRPGIGGAPSGGGGTGEDYSKEYYASAMEDWQKVTADFEEAEKLLQDTRTEYFTQAMTDWNQVSQEFYDAEYERDRIRAEEFIAIREEMRMEDLDALQAAMDAETAIIEQAMRNQGKAEEAKAQIARTAWQGGLDNVEYALSEYGKKSKTAFTAFKAVAIANTIISTYSAAQKSYDALADIPYVGPALGAAAAAAAIAAGMARVSAIQSTTPEGGGGAVGVYSASATTGLPTTSSPAPAPVAQGPNQGYPGVYIHIEGDSINDESYLERWAEKISDLVENRDVYLMASNSKLADGLV